MKKYKKTIISVLLMIIFISSLQGIVCGATDITSANLKGTHDIVTNVQFDDPEYGWIDLIAKYVYYKAPDGNEYPAYCINNRYTWSG